jgi:biotin synthase
LNVARQSDNGSNPRPDNRSGWLAGEPPRETSDREWELDADRETPDVVADLLARAGSARAAGDRALAIRLWDPSTQLRYRAKKRRVDPAASGWGD